MLYVHYTENEFEINDYTYNNIKKSFELTLPFENYNLLDGRTKKDTKMLIMNADLIYLGGGHLPTQNKFCRSFVGRPTDDVSFSCSQGNGNPESRQKGAHRHAHARVAGGGFVAEVVVVPLVGDVFLVPLCAHLLLHDVHHAGHLVDPVVDRRLVGKLAALALLEAGRSLLAEVELQDGLDGKLAGLL